MGLRGELQEALPDMFDAAGEDATFTPATGDPVTCKAFIDFDVTLEPTGFDGQIQQTETIIEVLLNGDEDAPDGISISRAPVKGETITIDAVVYTVAKIIGNDHFTAKLAVK